MRKVRGQLIVLFLAMQIVAMLLANGLVALLGPIRREKRSTRM